MRYGLALSLLLLTAGGALRAQEQPRPPGTNTAIEATAGNSALQLSYLAPSPWAGTTGRSDLDYGFLLTQNRNIIGSAALMFHTNLDIVPNLTIDVGPKGYLALLSDVNKTDVFAVAFGVDARYVLLPRWGIAAFGGAFYSPTVLTFGEADNVYDFSAGADVRFTPRLSGIAGYRWYKYTTIAEPDIVVQREVFAGLRWRLR
jgi:YfaZ precursor